MDKKTVADGQGGFEVSWVDGAIFMGGVTINTSIQTKIAEKQGVTSVYTITAGKNVILDFHDIIKRVSDGKIFRITSNSKDMETPSISSMNFSQVSAEKWSLV